MADLFAPDDGQNLGLNDDNKDRFPTAKKPFKYQRAYWIPMLIAIGINLGMCFFALILMAGDKGSAYYTDSFGTWLVILGIVSLIGSLLVIVLAMVIRYKSGGWKILFTDRGEAEVYSFKTKQIRTSGLSDLNDNLGAIGNIN